MNDVVDAPDIWSESRLPLTGYDPPLPAVEQESETDIPIWSVVVPWTILVVTGVGVSLYWLFNQGVGHLLYLASQG